MEKKNASLREELVKSRTVFKGRAVDMRVDTVRLPNGKVATREYLDHPGAVALVAAEGGFGGDPRLLFVRQFRQPVGEVTYEIPAGKLGPRELPTSCARRELEEETGYRAKSLRKIISFWPTPAFANEIIHIYAAANLVKGRFRPDEDEFLAPTVMRLSKALGMIKSGRIRDSKTIVGLLSFSRWRFGK